MARRMLKQDPLLDESLESPAAALHRARTRATFRQLRRCGGPAADVTAFALALGVDSTALGAWLQLPFQGQGWDALERNSAALERRPVERRLLARHHREAERIVNMLLQSHTVPSRAFDIEPVA